MNALATAPGVIAAPGKYYIGAKEVMEYLDCKENKAYELIRQLRDELVKAGKLTPAYFLVLDSPQQLVLSQDHLATNVFGREHFV